MLHTVIAFLPLLFLITYALRSRKMADAMVLATLLAMVLLYRHSVTGLFSLWLISLHALITFSLL